MVKRTVAMLSQKKARSKENMAPKEYMLYLVHQGNTGVSEGAAATQEDSPCEGDGASSTTQAALLVKQLANDGKQRGHKSKHLDREEHLVHQVCPANTHMRELVVSWLFFLVVLLFLHKPVLHTCRGAACHSSSKGAWRAACQCAPRP